LKKNERNRVNFLLRVAACFIDDLVSDEVEHANSLVVVGLTIELLSMDDTAIVRDVGIIELY
jgi:hypothetical protein